MSGPRVLVTDAQDRNGLAAARCLHAASYRVTAAASERLAPGLWSRACSSAAILPLPALDVNEFAARLEGLVRTRQIDILLPGTDEALFIVAGRRDRFEPLTLIGLPPPEAVEAVFNKVRLATEATKVGLSPPEQGVCHRVEEAVDLAREFGYPVFVKPVRTVAEVDDHLVRHPSRVATDERGLRELQGLIGPCIVQRTVAGGIISFGGVMTDQGLLGAVVSRYRRTWPPEAGSVSFSETVSPPAALIEKVEALVAALGWRGLFELELIEHDAGTVGAIDFNPRPYGSMALARAAGAPLATLWCGWLLGADPKPVVAKAGVSYRWEDADARHIVWQLRNADRRGAFAAMLPRRGVTHAYFRLRDPMPLVARGLQLGLVRFGRVGRAPR